MRRLSIVPLAALLVASVHAAPLAAQQPKVTRPASGSAAAPAARSAATEVKVKESKPGLLAKAKVTPEAAMATALAQVPGGHVTKGMIEEQKGKLIYAFDLRGANDRAVQHLRVDATTGAIVLPAAAPASAPAAAPAATKKP